MRFGAGIKGLHTPVIGLVHNILPLQDEICVLQATTKHCGNLAMRLQVVRFVARCSFLHCWAGLDEARTNLRWQLTLHLGRALAR